MDCRTEVSSLDGNQWQARFDSQIMTSTLQATARHSPTSPACSNCCSVTKWRVRGQAPRSPQWRATVMHHCLWRSSKEWLSPQEHAKRSRSVQAETHLKVLNETIANSWSSKLTACHSSCLKSDFFPISNHKCMQSIQLSMTLQPRLYAGFASGHIQSLRHTDFLRP